MPIVKKRKKSKSSMQKRKTVLLTYHSSEYKSTYHPLKHRRVKTEKIKYIFDIPWKMISNKKQSLTRRYVADIANSEFGFEDITGNEYVMLDWLKSIGIGVEEIQPKLYAIDGCRCSFGYVLLFANKQRIERKLKPFFVSWLCEC